VKPEHEGAGVLLGQRDVDPLLKSAGFAEVDIIVGYRVSTG